MNRRIDRWAWGSLFALAFCCGCGRQSAQLDGTVSWEGRPIHQGILRLDPLNELGGSGGNAAIVDGHFHIDGQSGLLPGKYRVSISALHSTGRMTWDAESLDGPRKRSPEVVQFIPPQYNRRSQLQVDLVPGPNSMQLDLTRH